MRSNAFLALALSAALMVLLGCGNRTSDMPTGNPGWQKSSDMYEVNDFTWTDITSPTQLEGNWIGVKLVEMPAVSGANPAYVNCVTLKMVHIGSTSNLYSFTEDQYFSEAVRTEEEWATLKEYLYGRSTGTRINTVYPGFIGTDAGQFWGTAAYTPGVTMHKDFRSSSAASLPGMVNSLSMKVSSDGAKLLVQYSDTIRFVMGK